MVAASSRLSAQSHHGSRSEADLSRTRLPSSAAAGSPRATGKVARPFATRSPARSSPASSIGPVAALYRKCRPQDFDEVVGQEAIVRTLKNAIERDQVRQAYLFAGPRGTGKTSMARILAKALTCAGTAGPSPAPDKTCPICLAIANGTSLDVVEMDAASQRGIDDIRE